MCVCTVITKRYIPGPDPEARRSARRARPPLAECPPHQQVWGRPARHATSPRRKSGADPPGPAPAPIAKGGTAGRDAGGNSRRGRRPGRPRRPPATASDGPTFAPLAGAGPGGSAPDLLPTLVACRAGRPRTCLYENHSTRGGRARRADLRASGSPIKQPNKNSSTAILRSVLVKKHHRGRLQSCKIARHRHHQPRSSASRRHHQPRSSASRRRREARSSASRRHHQPRSSASRRHHQPRPSASRRRRETASIDSRCSSRRRDVQCRCSSRRRHV